MVEGLKTVIRENPVVLMTRGEVDDFHKFLLKNNVMAIPCKIGDKVWVIRNHRGTKKPHSGPVSEMYFTSDMQLAIVVKGIGRGAWGVKIFPTQEAAERALRKAEIDGRA